MSQLRIYEIYNSICLYILIVSNVFDQACNRPDAVRLCAALRIEAPGWGWGARRLVIYWGVNVGSHTSPGPASKTRRDLWATHEEREQQSSYVIIFGSGMELFIVGSGFSIRHNSDISKDLWGILGVDGHIAVWDMLDAEVLRQNYVKKNRPQILFQFHYKL